MLVYEVDQRIEKSTGFGVVATAPDSLVNDFAAVSSFAPNITCTPDIELTRRLTQSTHASLGIPLPPSRYVGQVFDPPSAR